MAGSRGQRTLQFRLQSTVGAGLSRDTFFKTYGNRGVKPPLQDLNNAATYSSCLAKSTPMIYRRLVDHYILILFTA